MSDLYSFQKLRQAIFKEQLVSRDLATSSYVLIRLIGVLTQFAIVIGIMITQAMGLKLATPHDWRIVLMFSAGLSLAQLLLSHGIVESPVWLHRRGLLQEKAAASRKLWTMDEHLSPEPDCGACLPLAFI